MHKPKNIHICMVSDMHHMFDDRIHAKEAVSLRKAGYQVTHICVGNLAENFIDKNGICVIQLPRKQYFSNRILNFVYKKIFVKNLYKKMMQECKMLNADVYHLHDYKPLKHLAKLKKNKPIKLIYDVHDPFFQNVIDYAPKGKINSFIYKFYSKIIQRTERKYIKYYDEIIVTEPNLAKYYTNRYAVKPHIIYNYTTLNCSSEAPRNPIYDAIYVGAITKQRAVLQIIKAVDLLKSRGKEYKVAFVGKIESKALENEIYKYIIDKNLNENINFLGSVPYEKISEQYLKAKIGFAVFMDIPTHHIIMQIKLFEYTTMCLPMIGSNFGHVKKILETDKTGLLCNPDNPSEIADCMEKLSTDEELYKSLYNNALKVKDKYSWAIMESELLQLYATVLK